VCTARASGEAVGEGQASGGREREHQHYFCCYFFCCYFFFYYFIYCYFFYCYCYCYFIYCYFIYCYFIYCYFIYCYFYFYCGPFVAQNLLPSVACSSALVRLVIGSNGS
jgi:hypothetical protein